MNRCWVTCACHGMLESEECPLIPGCPACTHVHVLEQIMIVQVEPGETVADAIMRAMRGEERTDDARYVN